jgi:hypothetical protein
VAEAFVLGQLAHESEHQWNIFRSGGADVEFGPLFIHVTTPIA